MQNFSLQRVDLRSFCRAVLGAKLTQEQLIVSIFLPYRLLNLFFWLYHHFQTLTKINITLRFLSAGMHGESLVTAVEQPGGGRPDVNNENSLQDYKNMMMIAP